MEHRAGRRHACASVRSGEVTGAAPALSSPAPGRSSSRPPPRCGGSQNRSEAGWTVGEDARRPLLGLVLHPRGASDRGRIGRDDVAPGEARDTVAEPDDDAPWRWRPAAARASPAPGGRPHLTEQEFVPLLPPSPARRSRIGLRPRGRALVVRHPRLRSAGRRARPCGGDAAASGAGRSSRAARGHVLSVTSSACPRRIIFPDHRDDS